MSKNELRKTIREKKRQYSSRQLEELSLSVLSRLTANERFRRAHTLLMYHSLPDEVRTHALVEQMAEAGKRVLLPAVVGDADMILREYTGPQDLAEGNFHILEPTGKVFPPERYHEIDLALVPGMAFDHEGNRLGRGKGYYDRFLGRLPGLYKIGICFPFQRLEHIPTEPTDIRMDEIIC